MTNSDFTRRRLLAAAGAAAVAASFLAGPAAAQSPRQVVENALGAADAPVTIYEYASLTCPHCADFHINTLPLLKKDYVDTGKVRLIYREVYFDRPSLWAAMIARCAGADRYFGVLDLLFRDQANWAHAETSEAVVSGLFAVGRQAGMSDDTMQSCVGDSEFAKAMVESFQANAKADAIEATPTFIIAGEKVTNRPYEELKVIIDGKLAAAPSN